MKNIKAIGFDLFNTLITADSISLDKAMDMLIDSLGEGGVKLKKEPFRQAYLESAMEFIAESRESGIETHNRFWISAALGNLGHKIEPDDALITKAVEDYFSPFIESCVLIPGTLEVLKILKSQYRLGLLSNFTHGPAALKIIGRLNLEAFFEVILISGDLGYRKPSPIVFDELLKQLGVEKTDIIYIGDDTDADIKGAEKSGIQPVWMTYVQDHHVSAASSLLTRSIDDPDSNVPRISNWKELLALLDES